MKLTIDTPISAGDVVVTEAVDGIFRVEVAGATCGYVLRVGRIYVALAGAVFNTAVEIAQTHELDTAARRVAERV